MNETDRTPSWAILRAWLPVLAWLGIIVIESTDLLSSGHTENLLYRITTALFGHINRHDFDMFHTILRKVGHFVGYGILGLLVWRAKSITWPRSGTAATQNNTQAAAATAGTDRASRVPAPPWQWAAWAIGFTALIASLDEWHQTFLRSRTGAFHDVVLDTIGAVIFVIIARALWSSRRVVTRN